MAANDAKPAKHHTPGHAVHRVASVAAIDGRAVTSGVEDTQPTAAAAANQKTGEEGAAAAAGLCSSARELIRAVEPMAIEAAHLAERRKMERQAEHRRILELELQQARYEASLAERRLRPRQPADRRHAGEENWEAALRRVRDCEARLDPVTMSAPTPAIPDLTGIAEDLEAAWKNTNVTMRCRQQLVRALVNEIIVDIAEPAREIVLIIHWKSGQHSELRLCKPRTGEHACGTPEDALAVIRSMASRWSDHDIAATLNRTVLPTGQGKTWTAHRVGSIRRVRGIHAYKSAEKDGTWLTLREAAQQCGVTSYRITQADQGRHPSRRAGCSRHAVPHPGHGPGRTVRAAWQAVLRVHRDPLRGRPSDCMRRCRQTTTT